MKKTNENLVLLNVIFIIALVTANVVTAKIVPTGIPLFGSEIVLPGAVLCYALTFLMTDVIGEIWGKKEANRAVVNGFAGQLISTGLITLTGLVPATDPSMQDAYMMVLGQNWVFVVASLLAYSASQSWDVWVFHKIRVAYIAKHGQSAAPKGRWIWNNASTMTSQIIDTVIFIGVGFGFGMGWAFDSAMIPTLFGMMVGQYLFKFILAALDTPFFYLLTRKRQTIADTYREQTLGVE